MCHVGHRRNMCCKMPSSILSEMHMHLDRHLSLSSSPLAFPHCNSSCCFPHLLCNISDEIAQQQFLVDSRKTNEELFCSLPNPILGRILCQEHKCGPNKSARDRGLLVRMWKMLYNGLQCGLTASPLTIVAVGVCSCYDYSYTLARSPARPYVWFSVVRIFPLSSARCCLFPSGL